MQIQRYGHCDWRTFRLGRRAFAFGYRSGIAHNVHVLRRQTYEFFFEMIGEEDMYTIDGCCMAIRSGDALTLIGIWEPESHDENETSWFAGVVNLTTMERAFLPHWRDHIWSKGCMSYLFGGRATGALVWLSGLVLVVDARLKREVRAGVQHAFTNAPNARPPGSFDYEWLEEQKRTLELRMEHYERPNE